MHISLSPEIESLIKERVMSGVYTNSSEVVRAALRKFFHLEDAALSPEETAMIRAVAQPRLQAVQSGEDVPLDFDDAFAAAEKEAWNERL